MRARSDDPKLTFRPPDTRGGHVDRREFHRFGFDLGVHLVRRIRAAGGLVVLSDSASSSGASRFGVALLHRSFASLPRVAAGAFAGRDDASGLVGDVWIFAEDGSDDRVRALCIGQDVGQPGRRLKQGLKSGGGLPASASVELLPVPGGAGEAAAIAAVSAPLDGS